MSTDKDIELKAKTLISLFFINDHKTAKQFAITAVNEIIEVLDITEVEYYKDNRLKYWQQIKEKIKSL